MQTPAAVRCAMVSDELWTSLGDGAMVLLSGVLILTAVIAIIRIVGLRSLSKMSSFDFVVTVAIGSIIASVTATSTPVANGDWLSLRFSVPRL